MNRRIVLPSLASLPQTVCFLCNRSLINGLFTPYELAREDRHPKCMKCNGMLSEKFRRLRKEGHPWAGKEGQSHD
jgi:hypothetical protein